MAVVLSTANSRDVLSLRHDFPLLQASALGQKLHYLDNAATTHKPAVVIDAIANCYRNSYGPVHRGLYPLAEAATAAYENARQVVARFINCSVEQLIFTRSATESINMVAAGWARPRLRPGDRIWITRMEHHANLLPWQRVCREMGAELKFIELQEDGALDIDGAEQLFDERTRLIAVCQVSNVLGIENPISDLCARAAAKGIPVLIDAAQSVAHQSLDVRQLGCDFLAFSAHKMYGPTGVGVLYGKPERLEEMEPLLVGGGMVDRVGATESLWAPCPERFEAGSPNLADAVGLAAAVDYLTKIGRPAIHKHIEQLTLLLLGMLSGIPAVRIYGPVNTVARAGIVSFNVDGIHPHDLAHVLGEQGVAVRAGHHCCQPLMQCLGVSATARASIALYNNDDDVHALTDAIAVAQRRFS